MIVDELSVKITAEADNFKQEIASAKAALDGFRTEAMNAGAAVTEAFDGLIKTSVSSSPAEGSTPDTASVAANKSGRQTNIGLSSIIPGITIPSFGPRTVNVLDLDSSETVIGAVGGAAQETQPVNITTTVTLDGDKVGESVNRFNMRRDRITNGMYR